MKLQRNMTKISVFAQTQLSVTNASMRMDGSTQHSNQKAKHLKSGTNKKMKTQGVSCELTVLHLCRIGVECLVDTVSLKRGL